MVAMHLPVRLVHTHLALSMICREEGRMLFGEFGLPECTCTCIPRFVVATVSREAGAQ